MSDVPKFKVGEETYEFPTRFRFCDPVLIRELTGLEFQDFAERLDDGQKNPGDAGDPAIMTGLLGVAIWQANPTWKRERVVRHVEGLNLDEFSVEAADAGPPEIADPASLSLVPSAESTSSPESSDLEGEPA
jgi:hypothetical protein